MENQKSIEIICSCVDFVFLNAIFVFIFLELALWNFWLYKRLQMCNINGQMFKSQIGMIEKL